MKPTENEDAVKDLKDEEVEKVAGGANRDILSDEEPVAVLGKYGMACPVDTVRVKMAYGMKVPEFTPALEEKDEELEE